MVFTKSPCTGPLVAGGFDTSEEDSAHEDDSAREDDSAGEAPPWPPARCGRVRGSLPPIDEESRNMMPPLTSAAFTLVPATPSNSSQTSFASVGSAEPLAALDSMPRRSIRHPPRKPVGPPSLKSQLLQDLAPAADRHQPQVLLPPSPVRTASVGAADEVSFDEFETSEACCVNGASVGSVESGGAVAGSEPSLKISLRGASELPSGGWVEEDFIKPALFRFHRPR
ncbi:hypothetical protein B0H14DRAFT_3438937 [Mycena olivaceomarginata]|nr:hypothetical protein B0H14DRAFT_3438937 [Mycena olivaceomarginata]